MSAAIAAANPPFHVERQLTHAAQGHVLTNVNVWSPDGAWLVYDTRTDGFDGVFIERVRLTTGEVQRLYTSRQGAHCGVVTYSPTAERVVFIHGPEQPTADWSYGFSRRRGALVEVDRPGVSRSLDAMTYAPPFVAGALRGGSHVHVFSPDGQWVSFTYEDDVLAQLDAAPDSPAHEPNQRNVGVAVPAGPVRVPASHPRNHDGDWFSVVVTRTVAEPQPGSDEISKAFEEGWVGHDGYERADGQRQARALAFQGLVTAADGQTHAEVFIVDLPAELTRAGAAPLQGSATTRPAPPRGVSQRRLTFTSERRHRGVAAVPRHWLRVSPDGAAIAFLMRDDAGEAQLWTVSPRGGAPRQVTRNSQGVASAFTWSPDGRRIAHVMDGSVCVTDVASGGTRRLTERAAGDRVPSAEACVFSPDGRTIAFTRVVDGFQQIFVVAAGGESNANSM
ncbi:DUF3748 domain-containing protein [Synoicihabitans lomoniglobus]|uniref:DUF3748 domain-containing protein n=1 Tax=Synoicihabitans lomoniglobus TaxID=2909285 RepID=A0AAE9ZUP2_9BACT|nr:DUF3748 domain-containing protein [Opitutaceae bacterium LMO-M01]WED63399.1 DUF3748 domain-containing protein [Opitutaceae bacterium LMO-M01]